MSQSTGVLDARTKEREEMSTGIADDARSELSERLSAVLCDTYLLTIKSHICHWNIVGPLFKSVHDLTEEHYEDLFQAADVIAERIRALGHQAPSNSDNFDMTLKVSAPGSSTPDAGLMIEDLIDKHELIAAEMRDVAKLAGDKDDLVTEDLLTGRIAFHEKAAWMLRAMITA